MCFTCHNISVPETENLMVVWMLCSKVHRAIQVKTAVHALTISQLPQELYTPGKIWVVPPVNDIRGQINTSRSTCDTYMSLFLALPTTRSSLPQVIKEGHFPFFLKQPGSKPLLVSPTISHASFWHHKSQSVIVTFTDAFAFSLIVTLLPGYSLHRDRDHNYTPVLQD